MADIELVIKVSEDTYKDIIENGFIYDEDNEVVTYAIKNGTPIPDNATNGDVIKALYPDAKYDTYFDFIAMITHTERTVFMSRFDRDWWNAPYQKGGKE